MTDTTKPHRTYYVDLGDREEDERIQMIGRTVMRDNKIVCFVVDDWPGKMDRYIIKLKACFPGIIIMGTFPGPVDKCLTVKVGPPPATGLN